MKRKIFTQFLLTAFTALSFTMGASAQCSITSVAGSLSFSGYSFTTCSTITVTGYINDTDWGTIKTFLNGADNGASFIKGKTLDLSAATYTGAATGTTSATQTGNNLMNGVCTAGSCSQATSGTVIIPNNITFVTGNFANNSRFNLIGNNVTLLGAALANIGINDIAPYTLDLTALFPSLQYVASSSGLASSYIKSIVFPSSFLFDGNSTYAGRLNSSIDFTTGTNSDKTTTVTSITILNTSAPASSGNYCVKTTLDWFQASTNTSTTVYVPNAQLTAYQTLYPSSTYSKIVFAPTYSVTYDANTGSGTVPTQHDAGASTTITVASGSNLTKSGYSFSGWNTATDGSGTTKAAGSSYTIPSANTTFYAQWSPVTATNEALATNLKVRVVNRTIYVDGVDNFEVYAIDGQKMMINKSLQQGIYIVKSGNKMSKVFVNK